MSTPEENTSSDAATVAAFLDEADRVIESQKGDGLAPDTPDYRRLEVQFSGDRLEATLKAVFPGTTVNEVMAALKNVHVTYGVATKEINQAVSQAESTGRPCRDVVVARGRAAVYKERKRISYPFLESLPSAGSDDAPHLASSCFRLIRDVMASTSLEPIRAFSRPVLAAKPGDLLMDVQGRDVVEEGMDVHGTVVKKVKGEDRDPAKPGEGVAPKEGGIVAESFGYVHSGGGFLSVVSPIWISPDRMEAYYVNPPQLRPENRPMPGDIVSALEERSVVRGIDQENIEEVCADLAAGRLRESCVLVARGRRPDLAKGQIALHYKTPPPAVLDNVKQTLKAVSSEDLAACEARVHYVSAGTLMAEQSEDGEHSGPGEDLFGVATAPNESVQNVKAYKAGLNVRREAEGGKIRYVSEIYGIACVDGDKISTLSPLWVSPDRMEARIVLLPRVPGSALPTREEVEALLEAAHITHGVSAELIDTACGTETDPEASAAPIVAEGTPPDPGSDGKIELVYKQAMEPGKLLDSGSIDFRERDALPESHPGELLAHRMLPEPGKPGMNIRGKTLPPPRPERGLLFSGPNVRCEEEGLEMRYYATGPGFPRVVKDTLSVHQRFQHHGSVDYKVGNLKLEGDLEIEGTVKARFKVEATGDVLIGGAVEKNAEVRAGGNVVVKGGILGGHIFAKGSVYARFVRDSRIEAGEDLVVRNHVQDTHAVVGHSVVVQGEEAGERQLCLVGGAMVATREIDLVTAGSTFGRATRIVVGIDSELEKQIEKYDKGKAFADLRCRRALRTLGASGGDPKAILAAIKNASAGRKEFLMKQLKELEGMRKLRVSLDYHVNALGARREEIERLARIRITNTAFHRVTVQVGHYSQELDHEVKASEFRLNKNLDRLIEQSLS